VSGGGAGDVRKQTPSEERKFAVEKKNPQNIRALISRVAPQNKDKLQATNKKTQPATCSVATVTRRDE